MTTPRQVVNLIPTHTQLIPASELAPGEISSIRNNFIKRLVQIASTELKLSPDKIVVRDIRPKDDLDYTYQHWSEETGTAAAVYETMTTGTGGTATADRWIGIFGVMIPKSSLEAVVETNPAVLQDAAIKVVEHVPVSLIKFNIGGGDRAIWALEDLIASDDMVGFSPAGVVIPPSQPWTISRFVIKTEVIAYIVLKGVVVESRGRLISP